MPRRLREKIEEAERVPAVERLNEDVPEEKGGHHVNLERDEPISTGVRRRAGPD